MHAHNCQPSPIHSSPNTHTRTHAHTRMHTTFPLYSNACNSSPSWDNWRAAFTFDLCHVVSFTHSFAEMQTQTCKDTQFFFLSPIQSAEPYVLATWMEMRVSSDRNTGMTSELHAYYHRTRQISITLTSVIPTTQVPSHNPDPSIGYSRTHGLAQLMD